MVDGKVSRGEWTDAKRLEMHNGAHLYLKQAEGYVYFCVELAAGDSGFVDLYLSPADARIYDLHASAKLGQRLVSEGRPADAPRPAELPQRSGDEWMGLLQCRRLGFQPRSLGTSARHAESCRVSLTESGSSECFVQNSAF